MDMNQGGRECKRVRWVQGRGGSMEEKNWDNCNSIINKIDLTKKGILKQETGVGNSSGASRKSLRKSPHGGEVMCP